MKVYKLGSSKCKIASKFIADNLSFQFVFDSKDEREKFVWSSPKWIPFFREDASSGIELEDGRKVDLVGRELSEKQLKWIAIVHLRINWVDGFGKSPDDYSLGLYRVKGEYDKQLKLEKWLSKFEIEKEGNDE